jgi:hypothetical protein
MASKYIEGLWCNTANTKFGKRLFLNGDDSVLDQLANLPRNEKGQWTIVISPSQKDPSKLYAAPLEQQKQGGYSGRSQQGGSGQSRGGYSDRTQPRKQQDDGALPF